MTMSVVYIEDGEVYHLTNIVTEVKWSGDIMQASRKLEVSLSNIYNLHENGHVRLINVQKGREVRFFWNGDELFRGVVFKDSINIKGEYSFTAYDDNIYLTKNEDSKKFVKKKASEIIALLCNEFGIERGTIADTGYVIPKLILKGKTLWEMMITALTETRKHTGKRYVIKSIKGKLYLVERKTQAVQWILENGRNILNASYAQSIEEMRNKIKVTGGDDKKPLVATVKNDALIKTYGLMQHLEQADSDLKQSQLEALAKQLLADLATIEDEATVDALGIADVYAGKAVYVREMMTGIMGGYYVSADDHLFNGKYHTMSIKLTATDELPTMIYEAPAEEKPKKSTKKKKTEAEKKKEEEAAKAKAEAVEKNKEAAKEGS